MLTTSSVSAVIHSALLRRRRAAREHALRLVDGLAEQPRDEQLQRRGDEGRRRW